MMKTKLLLIPLVLLASACVEEQDDLNAWMQTTKQEAKSKLKPPQKPEPVEPVEYYDPRPENPHAFNLYRMRPPSAEVSISYANAPNLKRPKELLESADLKQLQFVGTIGSGRNLSALVSLDGKQVYTVNVGNYLGKNYGRVISITADEITLREHREDAEGNWRLQNTSLRLGEPYEEPPAPTSTATKK